MFALQDKAGCRVLINIILLRLASTCKMKRARSISFQSFLFRKRLSQRIPVGSHSAVWLIIFLQAFHPSTPVSRLFVLSLVVGFYTSSGFILENSITALANQDARNWSITPTIIEAKKDRLTLAVPQATVAVASYCKQRKYIFFFLDFSN